MFHQHAYRQYMFLILAALLSSWLPQAPLTAPVLVAPNPVAAPAGGALGDSPPLPASVTPPIDTTPSRPVLALALHTADDTVAIGDTTTITITVSNRGVVQASAVALTLPIPTGVTLVGAGGSAGQGTLTWDLGTLDAHSSATRALTVRATSAATGDPILFQPQASAPTAVAVAQATGGFVVVRPGLGAATVAFIPGTATTLTSRDGRIKLQVPPGLFNRSLTLRQRTLHDARMVVVGNCRYARQYDRVRLCCRLDPECPDDSANLLFAGDPLGFRRRTPGTGTARYRVLFSAGDRQAGTTAGVDANWEI